MKSQGDYSAAADRFRPVAQRYCSLVDSAVTQDKTEFLIQVYRMLPELVGEAMRLPAVEFGEDEDEQMGFDQSHSDPGKSFEQHKQLYDALKQKLGDWDLYWQVFDPTKDNEAIRGSLADDIAGVYGDMKEGLDYMKSDEVLPRDALFEWRLGFYFHWGRHAINALYTIHTVLNETLELLDSPD